jgi:AraC-like DNA-binding protein
MTVAQPVEHRRPTREREQAARVALRRAPECTVLALVIGAEDRMRLRQTVQDSATLEFVHEVGDVLAVLRRSRVHPSLVLLEPTDVRGRPSGGLVRQVVTLFPGVPVIGYCRAGVDRSAEVLAFATAGVHEILFKGIDDMPGAARAVIRSARQVSAGETTFAAIRDGIPLGLQPLARACLLAPRNMHTVSAAASVLSVHRKTLVNHCAQAGFPPPGWLLAWCRLLLAGHYLGTTTWTVETIAHELGFSTGTALRNMLRRYSDFSPLDVREQGGLVILRTYFHRALEAYRADGTHAEERE